MDLRTTYSRSVRVKIAGYVHLARMLDKCRAVRGHSDEALVEWFHRTAAPHSESELQAWNNMMVTRGPDTEEKWEYFRRCRDAVAPERTDITSWADLLDLEERRPVPIRNAAVAGGGP